ncbi:MAG: glycine cleavage system aminomethyltransferase GcvT [Actinomycetota bacterium]
MGRTVLHQRHLDAGARFSDFAGWELPLSFEGTVAEHLAVRSGLGVFDVSHLGTVRIEGPSASAVVAATFTNDPARLVDGQGQYTLLCAPEGGIVDDLLVYRLAADRFLAVPNAANTDAVLSVLGAAVEGPGVDVRIQRDPPDRALIALQGPDALEVATRVLDRLGAGDVVTDLAYLGVRETLLAGTAEPVVVCRSGYTGERGVELVVPAAGALVVWDALVDAGARPCGLGARDTLRLEMGYPLHGSELSVHVRPDEAGLSWAVRAEGRSFPGRDALQVAGPPARRAVGLVTEERRPARGGMRVLQGGREVGRVTSGTFSPTLGHGIALALVSAHVGVGAVVDVDVRGAMVVHEVVRPPFVDRDPRR